MDPGDVLFMPFSKTDLAESEVTIAELLRERGLFHEEIGDAATGRVGRNRRAAGRVD